MFIFTLLAEEDIQEDAAFIVGFELGFVLVVRVVVVLSKLLALSPFSLYSLPFALASLSLGRLDSVIFCKKPALFVVHSFR